MSLMPPIDATPEEDPWAIAIHEAGHLAAGFLLGRHIEKVTIVIQEDGKRGCYYSPIDDSQWSDFDEVATLLAGPRAQVELIPGSLPDGRLFEDRIILPMAGPRLMPKGVYDLTGWDKDIEYIYKLLCFPDVPAREMPLNFTHRKIVDLAEVRVREFCRDPQIQGSIVSIAKDILARGQIAGREVEEMIGRSSLSKHADGKGFLSWK